MDNKRMAEKIVTYLGGPENVDNVTHCATRLRFNLKDDSLANLSAISEIDGVLKGQIQNAQTQVIIGAQVQKVYQEIVNLYSFNASNNTTKKNKWTFSYLIEVIAGIFSPAIPVIIGGGMLKAVISLLSTYQLVNVDSSEFAILSLTGDVVFYFLPFIIGLSAAKRFKTNEFTALALAAAYMYPTILNGANTIAETGISSIDIFGLPILLVNYKSTVIPIILSVWLLSYVNRWVNRFIPDFLQIIFSSMIVLLLMIPVQLIFIGPLGYYLGEYFAQFITWFYTFGGALSSFVLGGLRSILTMIGMQYALGPLQLQEIAATGGSFILVSGLTANIAQAGSALAVGVKVKSKSEKSLAYSSSISALLGISEPAMFGVNLKYKWPFIMASVASAIGAMFLSFFNTKGMAYAPPSLLTLPTYSSNSMIALILGVVLTFTLAFGLTLVFGMPIKAKKDGKQPAEETKKQEIAIVSPLKGKLKSLTQVNDDVFSSLLMGNGVAIIPEVGNVYAPFDGKVTILFDSKHAIGLVSDNGTEILIHIGIDTVNLGGKYFESFVKIDGLVKKGELLLKFDINKIKEAGYDIISPIIVTNSNDYQSFSTINDGNVDVGAVIMKIQK